MTDIRELTERLSAILEEELNMVLELDELAQQKMSLLIKSDIKGLENILAQEEDAIANLQDKETQRLKCIIELAGVLGLKKKEYKLANLLDHMENDLSKQRLNETRQKLKFAVSSMARTNKKALAIASQRVNYTEYMINLITTPANHSELYDVQGKINESRADFGRVDYTV
jgi:hypothetical protein